MVKRSVTGSIARALAGIVMLSVLSTGLALLTLSGSLRDAEALNVAGSLRMQSYRLAWDASTQSADFPAHLQHYQHSLDAAALHDLDRFYVPSALNSRYQKLKTDWPELRQLLQTGDSLRYQQQVASWVGEIDRFVLDLQRYAELKIRVVAVTSLLGFIAIAALTFWTIRLSRRQIVTPLNQLVTASRYIEQGKFSYPPLNTALPNELGVLATAFTRMSGELEKHYQLLEKTVDEKTRNLTQANHMLSTLYECSLALAVNKLDRSALQQVLERVYQYEQLRCIEIVINNEWCVMQGSADSALEWHQLPLLKEGSSVGELRWQTAHRIPSPRLMQSVANMLARNAQIYQAQKQSQQLMLMEERATIARELHDSLAQALSYLRIQLTLLKRSVDNQPERAQKIIQDFDQALSDAWHQLRELLATFRLTIDQADLTAALQEMIASLRQQSQAEIVLNCQADALVLDAPQQVHVLQIIREALLNAIKHAQASKIDVEIQSLPNGDSHIAIVDNGIGIASLEEPHGHYGLTIMNERAERLGGVLSIRRHLPTGTQVTLAFSPQHKPPVS